MIKGGSFSAQNNCGGRRHPGMGIESLSVVNVCKSASRAHAILLLPLPFKFKIASFISFFVFEDGCLGIYLIVRYIMKNLPSCFVWPEVLQISHMRMYVWPEGIGPANKLNGILQKTRR
jgi:hypothetical protein